MIIKEYYRTLLDGRELYKFYSDQNLYVIDTTTGAKYTEAVNVKEKENIFIESTEKIPDDILKPELDRQIEIS